MTPSDGARARTTSFGRVAERRTDEELLVEYRAALLAAAWAQKADATTALLHLGVRAERA
jgi:hypothetical protein